MQRRHFQVAFVCGALAALCTSCRVPEPPVTKNPASVVLYDPKIPAGIAANFPPSAQLKEQNERYRKTLAEPVSVVAWEQDHSKWQVFYATNRVGESAENGALKFGGVWDQQPTLGACEVTLPRRMRASSAEMPKPKTRFASWSGLTGRKAAQSAVPVSVKDTRSLADETFFRSLREVVDRAPEHDVLLFVHGFNVSFDESMVRAAQIGADMPFNGAIVAYSWPTQGGPNNYSKDERIVAASVAPFVHFLESLDRALPPETKVHVVVHSMGNRLVLKGLSNLPQRFQQQRRFGNIVLAAPDVGVSDFTALAPAAVAVAGRVSLYVNGSDSALIISKGLHAEQRIGDAFPPVVVPGVETINASSIDTNLMGHSYYGSNASVLSDLFAVIKEDRGAAQRYWLKPEAEAAGSSWIFTAHPPEIRAAWDFDHLKSQAAAQPGAQPAGSPSTAAPALTAGR